MYGSRGIVSGSGIRPSDVARPSYNGHRLSVLFGKSVVFCFDKGGRDPFLKPPA